MKYLFNLFIFLILVVNSHTSNLKREFRGVWIATVKNIDWPSSPGLPVEVQKQELINTLNSLQQTGINAVLFQIRSECDALYNSDIEPWSYWLTGKQGQAPEPFYDPLAFIIEQAHKRGMELHTWFNPYRAGNGVAKHKSDSTHISFTHPEWTIRIGDYIFLNPGLKSVRDYTISVVMDVVRRYNIDGVHFDDYFYPYNGITGEDSLTFMRHPRGISNIEDWRRDNVNILIRNLNDSIKAEKPYVKFGISPFGIWKDGEPRGTTGFSAYHNIYCDAVYWLENKLIDYIAPQIYWEMGGPQDYTKLSGWWAEQSNGKHVYVGHAAYKMLHGEIRWKIKEITNQIQLNRKNPRIEGSIFFRTVDILNNINGISDSLRNNYYHDVALIPTMTWLDSIPPLFPFNLRAFSCPEGIFLQWQNPVSAKDKDIAKYNVVYRFKNNEEMDINNAKNILSVLPAHQAAFIDSSGIPNKNYIYLVTALDKVQNESTASNHVAIKYSQLEIHQDDPPLQTKLFEIDSIITMKQTQIKFSIHKKEQVKLSVFNNNGDKIFTLVDVELPPGHYSTKIKFNQENNGKYYYKLTTPTYSEMKSMEVYIKKN